MKCVKRVAAISLLTLVGVAPPLAAEPRSPHEVLVMQIVTVTGTLQIAQREAGAPRLEIDSDVMGRYRIDEHGLGAALKQYVGEEVTLVAFVEASEEDGRPILRVERYEVHGSI